MQLSLEELKKCETYKMQMQAICLATQGFWKNGAKHSGLETPALLEVIKLHNKYTEAVQANTPKYKLDDVLMIAVKAGVFDAWQDKEKLEPMIKAIENFYALVVGNADREQTNNAARQV
jgi:hypothetical protein